MLEINNYVFKFGQTEKKRIVILLKKYSSLKYFCNRKWKRLQLKPRAAKMMKQLYFSGTF